MGITTEMLSNIILYPCRIKALATGVKPRHLGH